MSLPRVIAGLCLGISILGPLAQDALGDGIPPVTVQLREQESGRFVAVWRVPQQLPMRAIPSPVMPESCRPVGERSLTERPGAWFLRQVYDCPDGIEGQPVGIDFPILNALVSTILRVELLSGDNYAHSFAPQEGSWRVPDASAGDARATFRAARGAVLAGARYFAGQGLLWGLLLVVLLLGGPASAARLGGVFALAQIAGVSVAALFGAPLSAALAQVGLAAGVVVLAREGLRPESERRQLLAVVAGTGLAHGLGLASLIAVPQDVTLSPTAFLLLTVLGMDVVLLAGAGAVGVVGHLLGHRVGRPLPGVALRTLAYVAGAGAVALAIGQPIPASAPSAAEAPAALQLPELPLPAGGSGGPSSRRLAAEFPEAPIQSFVTVAPFEVRHEVLVRLDDLAEELGVERGGTVELEELETVERALVTYLSDRHTIEIDGAPVEPELLRADFLTVDDRGVLPRLDPVVETVEEAWIGMTAAYLTPRTPTRIMVEWPEAAGREVLPATVTDPETTRSEVLTRGQPTLTWSNELAEDPTPVVSSIAVEPPVAWIPTLSLVVIGLGVVLVLLARRRQVSAATGPLARVALAGACLLAPIGAVAVPLPAPLQGVPDAPEAQRVLARLLPNIYRAFEFPTESAVYDRLALAATGDTLGEIYLEHRRAVELEERGGARARVEAVEVLSVDSVEATDGDGFVADAVWTVGGTVNHFGHRHFRQNRYDARVSVVPEEGTWKIRTIEVFDEERLQ